MLSIHNLPDSIDRKTAQEKKTNQKAKRNTEELLLHNQIGCCVRARLHRWVYYVLLKSTNLLLNCRIKLNFVSYYFCSFFLRPISNSWSSWYELRDILGRSFCSFNIFFHRLSIQTQTREAAEEVWFCFFSFFFPSRIRHHTNDETDLLFVEIHFCGPYFSDVFFRI